MVSPQVLWELMFSGSSHHARKGVPFSVLSPTMTLDTDASETIWGVHLNHFKMWSQDDIELHVNILELRAVAFLPVFQNLVVQILRGYMLLMCYISKQGGA